MGRTRKRKEKAVTLVEVMIATIVVLIIVVGVMLFQYSCALDARQADARATAGRLGLLLLEAWKANGEDITLYNPAAHFDSPEVQFGATTETLPGLAQSLGKYKIMVDGLNYYVYLSYNDTTAPRMLNVYVSWSRKFASGSLGDNPHSFSLTSHAI